MSSSTLFLAKRFDDRYLIVCGDDRISLYDGSTWSDITGNAVADGINERWSGGWLNGALTLANQKVVRTYQQGIDIASQPMVYDKDSGDTWESLKYSAHAFRPFREYMMAMGINKDGADYSVRVEWCDPVEPGQIPTDWVVRDDNRAGFVDLADTPGGIVDAWPMKDNLYIYKEDSIYFCQWIGGNEVFSFRRVSTGKGLYARNSIVEYNGLHWCFGAEDIFFMDGNEPKSVLWGRHKQSLLEAMDTERAKNNWAALDIEHEEIVFGYVSTQAPAEYDFPDRALVLNMRNNALFTRDYECEMPHAKAMLSVARQTDANPDFYGIDRTNSRILMLEQTPDRIGAPVRAEIQRSGLYALPAHDWVQVNGARLNLKGADAVLKMGNQIADDAAIEWRSDFPIAPSTDYKTDARQNGNQIAYNIVIDATTNWKLSGLDLLVAVEGSRG